MPTTLADDRRWNSADATARSERRWPRRTERSDSLGFRSEPGAPAGQPQQALFNEITSPGYTKYGSPFLIANRT